MRFLRPERRYNEREKGSIIYIFITYKCKNYRISGNIMSKEWPLTNYPGKNFFFQLMGWENANSFRTIRQ